MMADRQFDFFWDNILDVPKARMKNDHELLAQFLQNELQGDINVCDILIGKINKSTPFDFNGNMSSLEVGPDTVLLEPLFDDSLCAVSMDTNDFLAMVRQWKAFVQSN